MAPVTLCIFVPGKTGQVNLLSLLLPLPTVPVGLWGPSHGLWGWWAWGHAWTPGLQTALQRKDT